MNTCKCKSNSDKKEKKKEWKIGMSRNFSIYRTHTFGTDTEINVIKLTSEVQEKYIYCCKRTWTLPAVLLKI